MPRKRRWFRSFDPGTPLEKIGIKILENLVPNGGYDSTAYWIEWLCCGRQERLRHQRITHRLSHGTKMCRSCAAKEGAKYRGKPKLKALKAAETSATAEVVVSYPESPMPDRDWIPTPTAIATARTAAARLA